MARRFLESAQTSLVGPAVPPANELAPVSSAPVSPATPLGAEHYDLPAQPPETEALTVPGTDPHVDPDTRGDSLPARHSTALDEETYEYPQITPQTKESTPADSSGNPTVPTDKAESTLRSLLKSPVTYLAAAGNTQAYKLAKNLRERMAASAAENPHQRRALGAAIKLGSMAVMYGGVSAAMRVLPGLRYTPAAEIFDLVGILDSGPDALHVPAAKAQPASHDPEIGRWVPGEKPDAQKQVETGTHRIPMAQPETGGQKTGAAPDAPGTAGKQGAQAPQTPEQPTAPKSPPTPEFSKAARTVESGEGWFKELDQIGVTDADDQATFLKEHGKQLEARGLAYWDPDQHQWGMNRGDGTISQDDLTWIHNTAVHDGLIESAPAPVTLPEQPDSPQDSINAPDKPEDGSTSTSDGASNSDNKVSLDDLKKTIARVEGEPVPEITPEHREDKGPGFVALGTVAIMATAGVGGAAVPLAAKQLNDHFNRLEKRTQEYVHTDDESKVFVNPHGKRGKKRGASTAPTKWIGGAGIHRPGGNAKKRRDKHTRGSLF
jgi:hypothetical protein